MVTQISWTSYINIVVISLIGYYLVIILKYYRQDLLQLLLGKKNTLNDTVNFTATQLVNPEQGLHEPKMLEAFEKQNHFQLSQSLADEILAFLNEAGRNKVSKQEIVKSLQLLLNKYPALQDSSFKEFIQNFIETECEANCSVQLSEEELSALWD